MFRGHPNTRSRFFWYARRAASLDPSATEETVPIARVRVFSERWVVLDRPAPTRPGRCHLTAASGASLWCVRYRPVIRQILLCRHPDTPVSTAPGCTELRCPSVCSPCLMADQMMETCCRDDSGNGNDFRCGIDGPNGRREVGHHLHQLRQRRSRSLPGGRGHR
jgi:hypothetical protein